MSRWKITGTVTRMKTIFTLIFGIIACFSLSAQSSYHTINISGPEYLTIESFQGIETKSIIPSEDGSFSITLFNTNYSESGVITTNNFQCYLSYKGKRISDYFNCSIRCRKEGKYSKYVWPGTVPIGNEKYVTVQFGREPIARDRRDDDY